MKKSAARIVDMHTCPAPMESGTGTHVGGNITPVGLRTVSINGQKAATVNDVCVCPGSPNFIKMGSTSVFINGQKAARQNDLTQHGGSIKTGSHNVFIGD
jgi:uncharacterized Zn-binding protein involved in type VI secretion